MMFTRGGGGSYMSYLRESVGGSGIHMGEAAIQSVSYHKFYNFTPPPPPTQAIQGQWNVPKGL